MRVRSRNDEKPNSGYLDLNPDLRPIFNPVFWFVKSLIFCNLSPIDFGFSGDHGMLCKVVNKAHAIGTYRHYRYLHIKLGI